MSDVVLSRYA